jgi:hypothetical protein
MGLRESLRINGLNETLAPVYIAAALILLLGLFAFVFFQRFSNDAEPFRMEYEGQVVDKWQTLRETFMGSEIDRSLLIRDDEGKQFKVVADDDLYEKARIGMWIKRAKDGTILVEPER